MERDPSRRSLRPERLRASRGTRRTSFLAFGSAPASSPASTRTCSRIRAGWGFADYLGLDSLANTHLALYSVNPEPAPIHPIELGFVHGASGSGCSGRTFCITHSFDTWIADGATWTSPVVRLRVGETVDQTLTDYRHDNGLDLYPSVADKLGAKFAQYAQAPLIKADARKGLPPLAQWASDLRRLPSPRSSTPFGSSRARSTQPIRTFCLRIRRSARPTTCVR